MAERVVAVKEYRISLFSPPYRIKRYCVACFKYSYADAVIEMRSKYENMINNKGYIVHKNNKMISELFLENSKFIVVGLTGRTGSGCTTTANILESDTPDFPDVECLNDFYTGLDKRRYEIVKKYAEKHWNKFYSIKVSDLISTYILMQPPEHIAKFIHQYSEDSVSEKLIYDALKNGIFTNNHLIKTFKPVLDKILDHSNDADLEKEEINKFITILTLIRRFNADFKKQLDSIKLGLYVSTYQAAGNSIRRTGKVQVNYEQVDFIPECVFHLPETINRAIKIIRKARKNKAYIVIDAIRNPYEAKFFKDRYSAFHLLSINAPDEHRNKYLQSIHKFSSSKLEEIERIESGKGGDEYSDFTVQNIKKCIEASDIHIFNPRNELENSNVLKAQIAWYVALMLHPGLVTPTSMERVMQIAYTAKMNSGCTSRQVGAVVTDSNNSIKSVGWNDVAKGQVPCSLRSLDGLLNEFDPIVYSHFERHDADFRAKAKEKMKLIHSVKPVLEGHNISYCFKDLKNEVDSKGNQVHTRSLHAEENAFLQLTKYGSAGIEGGKLYTTASPCELCAKKAYQLGMADVIFIDPYPGIAKDHILNIGESVPNLVQFRGAIGRAYHRLYEQVLPLKDELNFMVNL